MDKRDYLNFEPVTEWIHEKDGDILLLSLPDFSREHLKVQLSQSSRALKISGERPIGRNKWSRFSKEFPVSSNCDINKLKAQFRNGILYVEQPKLIISAEKKEKLENQPNDSSNINNNEPLKYQKPKDGQENLENQPLKFQQPKEDQEKIENKPIGSNEPIKPQNPKDDQETTELHKDAQSKPHKTTGQKGDQETTQIANPMGKLMDQKLGYSFEDFPKKETIAKEVPEKSSSKKEDKRGEIVGDEKNERKYDEDEYDQAINRAMKIGQPSTWVGLLLVFLFIALVWFHLMYGTIIEGSEN